MGGLNEVLYEEGIVVGLAGTTAGGSARVRVQLAAGDHCEACPSRGLCRPERDPEARVLEVADPVGVALGDRVRVAVPGGAVLRASFLVYGLPLLLLLLGVAAGFRIWPADAAMRDLWSFLLGAGLAAAGVPLVVRLTRGGGGAGELEASVAEKLPAVVLNAES